jgi:hypothetical protein
MVGAAPPREWRGDEAGAVFSPSNYGVEATLIRLGGVRWNGYESA